MAWPHPIEAEQHIRQALGMRGIQVKNADKRNISICCPFSHLGETDVKFKMRITKDGKGVHCWVCKWSGNWNEFAEKQGLQPFGSKPGTYGPSMAKEDVFDRLHKELESLVEEPAEDAEKPGTLPDGLATWTQDEWRGLTCHFLRDVPTHLWNQQLKSKRTGMVFKTIPRAFWPFYQLGALVGYTGRRLDDEKESKYYNAKWMESGKVLFPFDYVQKSFPGLDRVVLVEGPHDALSLLQAGIPTLALLGAGNWNDYKVGLLHHLGVKRVLLCFDGDPAGRLGIHRVMADLGRGMDKLLNVELPDKVDPGSLGQKQKQWLKDTLENL